MKRKIQGQNIVSFKQVWDGKKPKDDRDRLTVGFSNLILGIIISFIIIFILNAIFW